MARRRAIGYGTKRPCAKDVLRVRPCNSESGESALQPLAIMARTLGCCRGLVISRTAIPQKHPLRAEPDSLLACRYGRPSLARLRSMQPRMSSRPARDFTELANASGRSDRHSPIA